MAITELPQVIIPSSSFRKEVGELSLETVSACFQCGKCTSGCPVTFAMDIAPHRLMRLITLGLRDEVLKSDTIWVCASCETCTTRCPNSIDIAHIMDTLRQISQREGRNASQEAFPLFHSAFLSSVKRHGRLYELEMTADYMLRSAGLRGLFKQAGLGMEMFKRGKLKILPNHLRANSQVRSIFSEVQRKGQR